MRTKERIDGNKALPVFPHGRGVRIAAKATLVIFATYGLLLTFIFFAIKYGLTNVGGAVDTHWDEFEKQEDLIALMRSERQQALFAASEENARIAAAEQAAERLRIIHRENACKISSIAVRYPANAVLMAKVARIEPSGILATKMILAASLRLQSGDSIKNALKDCNGKSTVQSAEYADPSLFSPSANLPEPNIFPWMNRDEWGTIERAILKDKDAIDRACRDAGIESRLLVSNLVVEQLRLFHSQRELYERFFAPLNILGNATKISLGVMGIKEATATQIEDHIKDPKSPYYLGKEAEHLLDFASKNIASERFSRLTNDKDHYYSYLYAALYIRQFIVQWDNAGYPIRYRPEIVGTLYNVGFPQSAPKPNPKVGGSTINVVEGKYSFGSLAYEFYYSGTLLDDFPYEIVPS
jgi:hypothetical protein